MFIFNAQKKKEKKERKKDIHVMFNRKDNFFVVFICLFHNLSNCNAWTWWIDGSHGGSEFY